VPPGNTVSAMEEAIRMGAEMAEIDLRRLADGVIVCHHDATVDGEPLSTLDRPTLDRLTAAHGYQAPTLEQVVETCRGRIALDVELKEGGYEAEVLDLLAVMPSDQWVTKSFLDAAVATCRYLAPKAGSGLLLGTGDATDVLRTRLSEWRPTRRLRACDATFVSPNGALATSDFLRRMRGLGLPVWVWTVNEERAMIRMAKAGVDAVITDHPDVALALYREMASE